MKAIKYMIILIYIQGIAQEPFNTYKYKNKLNKVNFNIHKRNDIQIDSIVKEKKEIKENYLFQFSLPLDTLDLTSGYGMRIHPVTGEYSMHYGIDLKGKRSSIRSILNSLVKKVGYNKKNGNFIILESGIYKFYFLHMEQIFVRENDYVIAGQELGLTGNSGLTTGYHLHLAIKKNNNWVDPLLVLKNFTQLYINQISKK